jgi:hypothetical protein
MAAVIRRRFSTATGSLPRTGLWVKAITFVPVVGGDELDDEGFRAFRIASAAGA